jgi:very-short-patch-repair endonuclease
VNADDFLARHAETLAKTRYERRFAERVLRRVRGLDWSAVRPQHPFTDAEGRRRYIDFALLEGDTVRIAIEVDGFDKTGNGQGMSRAEFIAWSRREQAMVAAGWRLIRVANALVDREPERCVRTVELVLKRERALARRLAALPASQRADVDGARRRLAGELLTAPERNELRELAAVHAQAFSELETRLGAEIERREAAERGREQAHAERRGMLSVTRYFTVALVAVAIIVASTVLVVARNDRATGSAGICDGAENWQRAAARVGQQVRVKGPVVATRYQAQTRGRPTFLDVGAAYPDPRRLTVVVWGQDRSKFPEAPDVAFAGKEVAVRGKVTTFRGVTQIDAAGPNALAAC